MVIGLDDAVGGAALARDVAVQEESGWSETVFRPFHFHI